MTTSFWVVDIVRECRCIPEVREILKIEKELSYVTYMQYHDCRFLHTGFGYT